MRCWHRSSGWREPKPSWIPVVDRINGAVMVLGGLGVALGIRRRLTALGSIASLVATAIGGHAFGRESEEPARTMQRSQFLETLGLLGLGLVVLKPSQHRND